MSGSAAQAGEPDTRTTSNDLEGRIQPMEPPAPVTATRRPARSFMPYSLSSFRSAQRPIRAVRRMSRDLRQGGQAEGARGGSAADHGRTRR